MRGQCRVRRVRLAVFALAGTAACIDSSSITIEEEREMGLAVAQQATTAMPVLEDEPVARFVRELGKLIVSRADTTGRAYEFKIVDSEMANAFAIPGGFVFINRGILERAESASELGGVIAHEIGHVVERHGLEQMAKAQNTNTVVSLVYVLLGRAPGAAEQVALHVAGSAWMAKHSREAEREADRVAVMYLARAGLDPRGMPRFFERLLEEERRAPSELLAWFSTHPLTEERIADAEAMIEQLPATLVERGARDLPQFAQMRRRLETLPPAPASTPALP
ncbi:MAG: M48 family metallopeptidase [Gemmatimonadaceae bacterium]